MEVFKRDTVKRTCLFLVPWALLPLGITVLIKTGQSCQLTHLSLSVQKFVMFLVSVFSVSRCHGEECGLSL